MIFSIEGRYRFRLDPAFLAPYRSREPQWGPLGHLVYLRTYAREIADERSPGGKRLEHFSDTLQRGTEFVFSVLAQQIGRSGQRWDAEEAQTKAQEFFRRAWEGKFMLSGRMLWFLGAPALFEKGGAPLFNCVFVSTNTLHEDFADPFAFMMDFLMCGCGVGFDTRGKGFVPKQPVCDGAVFEVQDSREGWVAALRAVFDAFTGKGALPSSFDVSRVRPKGVPIASFGGTSSGPEPLLWLLEETKRHLLRCVGQPLTAADITDLMNRIGVCVVAGNVRRSSQIALGEATDQDFVKLKDPVLAGDALTSHRWASNNTVFADQLDAQTLQSLADQTARNGEPGYFWFDVARTHGRLADGPDERDTHILGLNPCQPAWATVLTPEGIRTIGQINVGDTIWSGQRWTRVIRKVATGTKVVNAYRTTAGTFYGTAEHRVVCNGSKVQAQDAQSIDVSVGPSVVPSALDPRDVLDGLVVGDGTVHRASNGRVLLCIGENDNAYHTSEIAPLLGSHRPGIKPGAWEVSTTVSDLPLTYDRFVPDAFRYGSPEKMRGFLRGLYSANGSVCGHRVTLKSSSRKLIDAVQEMLSALGIGSYVTTNRAHAVAFANGTYTCRESYDLNIGTWDGRRTFRSLIGFIHPEKTARLDPLCAENDSPFSHHTKKKTFPIESVEQLGAMPVFDITVEAEEHTYWTGGLLVSNCGEVQLEDRELCNVPETFPGRHESLDDYLVTLKYAYLLGKVVSLIPTHNAKTNAVITRNRRLGISMAGVAAMYDRMGMRECIRWWDTSYKYLRALDRSYSRWMGVNESVRLTSIKPGGTVPLLFGEEGGMKWPSAKHYFRTVRLASDHPLVRALAEAGHRIEKDKYARSTVVAYFPVRAAEGCRMDEEVPLWEKAALLSALQTYWADNSVSATLTFSQQEAPQIARVVAAFTGKLKTVSFLPRSEHGYEQAPYQQISAAEYERAAAQIRPLRLSEQANVHDTDEKFCSGEVCERPAP